MSAAPVEITSAANGHFRALLKLHQSSRERRKTGRSLLDGVHLVSAYLQYVGTPEAIAVSHSALQRQEIAGLLSKIAVEPLVLGDALFSALSSVSTPTGIIATIHTPKRVEARVPLGPCVMLEVIQDPGNLGSILRSAAAAGIDEIYLSAKSVHAWSPKVLRAGMGAHFALRIHEGVDLEALASSFGGPVYAAARTGSVSLFDADLRGRVALIFGNEGAGLTPALEQSATQTLRIPMPGAAESLNVAAAAAVCLFERVRQCGLQGRDQ